MTLSYYVQLVLTLAVFVAVLYAVVLGSRYLQKKTYAGELKLVDRLAVDTNVSLVVGDYLGSRYFLSVGGKDIKLVEKLSA